MKKFSIFLLILIILVALFYYFFPLERVVKNAINKYGSEVTGTNVSLSGFDINLKKGEVGVNQITISNPKNYKTKYAIQFDNISAVIDLKSLTTDTILIKEISVNKPTISYEMMSLTQNNISDLIDTLSKYTSASSSKEVKKESSDNTKKVVIQKITINNGEINGAINSAPDAISAAIPLPAITLNNIGENSKGMSVADTIAYILNKVLSAASTTVISSNFANLKDATQGAVDSTKEATGGLVSSVKNGLSNLNPFEK